MPETASAISPRAALAFELGLAAHNKGDFRTALARFSEAHEAAPDWHEAGFALSHTHERLGDIEHAFIYAVRCLRPGPANPDAVKYFSDLLTNYPIPTSFAPTRDDLAAMLAPEAGDLRRAAALAIAALKRTPPLSDALTLARQSGFAAAAKWVLSGDGQALLDDAILHRALRIAPITDAAVELLLAEIHRALSADPRLIGDPAAAFAEALRAQCQLNGYVWFGETGAKTKEDAHTAFGDATSQQVARQYEENPYPTWTHANLPPAGSQLARLRALQSAHGLAQTPDAPRVLIAGCGTGHQALQVAVGLGPDARILACDLSAASLAYAKRKAVEHGVGGIEFRQADILDLGGLSERFDIVACTGVLHHMNDPLHGWRILTGLTAPGGAQHIALYSALARAPLDRIRERFPPDTALPIDARIREFRARVLNAHAFDWETNGVNGADFFTLNGCRDLLFHAHEDRYTIPRIAEEMESLGLRFLDFILPSSAARDFAGARDDLAAWNTYEHAHPQTFTRMYEFWCAKAAQSKPPPAAGSVRATDRPLSRRS